MNMMKMYVTCSIAKFTFTSIKFEINYKLVYYKQNCDNNSTILAITFIAMMLKLTLALYSMIIKSTILSYYHKKPLSELVKTGYRNMIEIEIMRL